MSRLKALSCAAIIAAMVAGLTGCLPSPPPPEGLADAVESYEQAVRALPGVAAAVATATPIDPKDRPGEWQVTIVVDASSAEGLIDVPTAVAAVTAPRQAQRHIVVRVPGAAGVAPVVMQDAGPGDLKRASVLRELPFAISVQFWSYFSLQLRGTVELADAAAQLRASGALGADSVSVSYSDHRVSVDVSMAGPSAGLIDLIQQFQQDSGVDHVSAREPRPEQPRPSIFVDGDDLASRVQALVELDEPIDPNRPRTSFSVSNRVDDIRGFVGLPLGSPEPDDLPSLEPPPVDPAVLEAELVHDTAAVAAMLDATITSSGYAATPELGRTTCGASPDPAQVWGSTIIPVFDYVDSAQPAYDAIVAGWEDAGYTHTDQAMGESIYTSSTSQSVEQLSIRGTSEGIRVSVVGACRG